MLLKITILVIPAPAGIQCFRIFLDSHFRGNDRKEVFFKGLEK
ncbi:MAG: hypothetical protein NTZ24_15485 [Deltaproteobacteria bacterium]|nr:hypothetical protein [Deltaproteobacteria bacterium]